MNVSPVIRWWTKLLSVYYEEATLQRRTQTWTKLLRDQKLLKLSTSEDFCGCALVLKWPENDLRAEVMPWLVLQGCCSRKRLKKLLKSTKYFLHLDAQSWKVQNNFHVYYILHLDAKKKLKVQTTFKKSQKVSVWAPFSGCLPTLSHKLYSISA